MNHVVWIVGAVVAGAALGASGPRPAPESPTQPAPVIPVIAYLPDYRLAALDPAVCSSLTDLIYFSVEPTAAGGLDASRLTPAALRKLHEIKAQHPVRLLVALGGWGRSNGFSPMALDAMARARFVRTLVTLCRDNGFDGVDFDWEHPANAAEEAAYAALLVETKQAFAPDRLLVTVAMASWQNLPADAYAAVDRVHLMAYDHEGRHSTLEAAISDVAGLVSQGVPRAKICLGVPFYGREITRPDQALAYAQIVQQYHPAPEIDEAAGFYFNGIRTIQRKARYAVETHLGGLMIWEVGQDTNDATSLLRAIRQVVEPCH